MTQMIWVFGLMLNLIGSVIVSLGMNYLKLSVRETGSNKEIKAHFKGIGGFFFVIGSIINFISFGYAPQSLLASLGGIQFVCSLCFGHCILNEVVTSLHVMAAFILSTGVCIAVIFSSHQEKLYASAQDILILYDRSYIIFIVVLSFCLICAEMLYHVMNMIDDDELEVFCCNNDETVLHQSHAPVPLTSLNTSEFEVDSAESPRTSSSPSAQSTAVDIEQQHRLTIETLGGNTHGAHVFEKAFLYSIVSATIGTQSVLQAKCVAELIKTSIVNHMDFSILFVPELSIFVFIFLTCLSVWIYRLMSALQLFDGLIIIPLLQVCWTLSAIVQGGVFFQEFQQFSDHQFFYFCLGVFIMICGVMLLSYASNQNGSMLSPHFEFTYTPTKLTPTKCNESHFNQRVVHENEEYLKRKSSSQYQKHFEHYKEEHGDEDKKENIEDGFKNPIPLHLQKGKPISINFFTRMNQSEEDWVYNPKGPSNTDDSTSTSSNPFGPSSLTSTENESTMSFFKNLLSYRR